MSQMQDHYDRLLLKAKTELEALREQLNVAHEDLDKMQWRRVTQTISQIQQRVNVCCLLLIHKTSGALSHMNAQVTLAAQQYLDYFKVK